MNNIFELKEETPYKIRLELIKKHKGKAFISYDWVNSCETCGKPIKADRIFCNNCKTYVNFIKKKGVS